MTLTAELWPSPTDRALTGPGGICVSAAVGLWSHFLSEVRGMSPPVGSAVCTE